MNGEDEVVIPAKYFFLKLSKQVDLKKLLKKLKFYHSNHRDIPTWKDLTQILSSVELEQTQTKIGDYLENQADVDTKA